MRKFKITVNGSEYEVLVEEITEESEISSDEQKNNADNQEKRK